MLRVNMTTVSRRAIAINGQSRELQTTADCRGRRNSKEICRAMTCLVLQEPMQAVLLSRQSIYSHSFTRAARYDRSRFAKPPTKYCSISRQTAAVCSFTPMELKGVSYISSLSL